MTPVAWPVTKAHTKKTEAFRCKYEENVQVSWTHRVPITEAMMTFLIREWRGVCYKG